MRDEMNGASCEGVKGGGGGGGVQRPIVELCQMLDRGYFSFSIYAEDCLCCHAENILSKILYQTNGIFLSYENCIIDCTILQMMHQARNIGFCCYIIDLFIIRNCQINWTSNTFKALMIKYITYTMDISTYPIP